MISINYNPSVLRAQNNLSKANNATGVALHRMSTGYKINSAQDDAAGLYIATGLNTKIRGLKQAQKNVSTGISILNIAEGSLNNMSDMLNRVRDLALQGANSYYSDDSRAAMQGEADKLVEEIVRINKSTNFNGMKLFDNTEESEDFQHSARKASANISVTGVSADAIPAGYKAIYTVDDLNNIRNDLSGKYILMNDIDLSSVDNWNPIGTGLSDRFKGTFDGNGHVIKNLKINSTKNYIGLFGWLDGEIKNLGLKNVNVKGETQVGALAGYFFSTRGSISNCYSTGTVNGNSSVGGLVGGYLSTLGTISNCYSTGKVNGNKLVGGLIGSSNGPISNNYTTCEVTGNSETGLICGFAAGKLTNIYADKKNSALNAFGTIQGKATITNSGAFEHSVFTSHELWEGKFSNDVWEVSCSIPPILKNVGGQKINWNFGGGNKETRLQVGADSDSGTNALFVRTGLDLSGININLSTIDGCLEALDCINAALNAINQKTADIGASQNRLDSVVKSQITQIENFTSAKSTIMDADIAQESAEFTKQQILTQTSSTLLVQAKRLNANTAMNLINSLR